MTWLSVYQAISPALEPVVRALLYQRCRRGKEMPERLAERRGHSSLPRPGGQLVWIHAASVGESLSILPVVEALCAAQVNVLITTGTVTSAQIMARRAPPAAVHHFVPVDVPRWVSRFLDHWHPDAAVWVESEFWPNLLRQTAERGIPMALVNGRMSAASFKNWQARSRSVRQLLACFSRVWAQSATDAERLQTLAGLAVAPPVRNLKLAAAPLPADQAVMQTFKTTCATRPVWLAASIHPGEVQAIVQAHHHLVAHFPDMLTIIVPRHPDKAAQMHALVVQTGLRVAQRSAQQPISSDTDVYLADTMGELGVFYRLCDVVLVGGSLCPHGGQNPLEAARLDSAILMGPYLDNFPWLADVLPRGHAYWAVETATDLAEAVAYLWRNPAERQALQTAAQAGAQALHSITRDTVADILSLMEGEA